MTPQYMPIKDVAIKLGRSVEHIRQHIEAGNLRAINTSLKGTRKEYSVLIADVEQFERSRMVVASSEKKPAKAKKDHLG